MIILSPIKIIVNFDNHFIDFYDKSCEKCNHNKYNKKDMVHLSFFKLSIQDLNKEYRNQNIDLYIQDN